MDVFVAPETSQAPHRVCEKEEAPENMLLMSVTDNTFHLEMSTLNAWALPNMKYMLVTADTSHLEMSPLNAWAL